MQCIHHTIEISPLIMFGNAMMQSVGEDWQFCGVYMKTGSDLMKIRTHTQLMRSFHFGSMDRKVLAVAVAVVIRFAHIMENCAV